MKKLILSLFLTMAAVSLKAQTDYFPNNNGTIVRSGYTYKFEMEWGSLTVYNAENRFTGVYEAMKDGSMMSSDDSRTSPIEEDGWTKRRAVSIVQEAMNTLPVLEKSLVAGKKLFISLYIDSSTGKICDVVFRLSKNDPFRYVPIEIYRKIETDLKSQLLFTVSDFGRKLNYAMVSWIQTIKFDEPTPPDPKPPVDPNPPYVDPNPKDPNKPVNPGEPDPQLPIDWLQSVPGKPATSQAPKSELE